MEKICIININKTLIYDVLMWLWWPTKISHGSYIYNSITIKIIREIRDIVEKQKWNNLNLDIFQLFTLIRVLDYMVMDLWIDEFSIITWYSLEYWLELIEDLKKYLD